MPREGGGVSDEMTAEITLLNRRALVFAADSAVTISDGTRNKIYNTAEKIFELSRKVPLGLMLYNSMEFVGVPLDILIRKFRADKDTNFRNCKHACKEFLKYLREFNRYKENEDRHLEIVISEELREIGRQLRVDLPDYLVKIRKPGEQLDIPAARASFLAEIIEEHTKVHREQPLDDFLADVTVEQFRAEYEAVLNRLIAKHLKQFADDERVLALVASWALAALRSKVFSESVTGLVFGGFGEDDLFPSAYSVELDGIFFGQLKLKETHDIDIDRRKDHAKIVPFAQSEMAERFLFGIDADMETSIIAYTLESIEKVLGEIQKASGYDPAAAGVTPEVYATSLIEFLGKLKKVSRNETLDMVDFMPKQELAYAAESFVNLTSIKRKVSAQQETVGGPVDVAVITRNEGFVWIKRKHYFDVELNPGYAVRTFGMIKTEDHRNDGPTKAPRGNRGSGKTPERNRKPAPRRPTEQ